MNSYILTDQELKAIRNAIIFSMKYFDEKGNNAEKQLSNELELISNKLALAKAVEIKY